MPGWSYMYMWCKCKTLSTTYPDILNLQLNFFIIQNFPVHMLSDSLWIYSFPLCWRADLKIQYLDLLDACGQIKKYPDMCGLLSQFLQWQQK